MATMIEKLAEPKNAAELVHVIRLLLADAFPRLPIGGGEESILVDADDEDVTITVESVAAALKREASAR